MSTINSLSFYSTQSPFSDPGEFGYLYQDFPDSIEQLCEIVHGLIVNPCDTEKLYGFSITDEQYTNEVNLHNIKDILEKIVSDNPSPLTVSRVPEKRLAGLCRHFALLLVSILRYKGIPARVRCGFETYYKEGVPLDHWVAEYWDKEQKAWQLVDPEIGDEEIKASNMIATLINIPEGEYLTAGEVWQLCRTGKADPDQFQAPVPGVKGWWFIRANVLKDFYALNKIELVPWDYTEFADKQFGNLSELNSEEIELFDCLAEITSEKENINFTQLRNLYLNDPKLQVGKEVSSYLSDKTTTTLLK